MKKYLMVAAILGGLCFHAQAMDYDDEEGGELLTDDNGNTIKGRTGTWGGCTRPTVLGFKKWPNKFTNKIKACINGNLKLKQQGKNLTDPKFLRLLKKVLEVGDDDPDGLLDAVNRALGEE